MKIKIGISPCPNDTFMFDAMINKRIDTMGYDFELHIADVEELNSLVLDKEIAVSKLSYATYLKVWKEYKMLRSGSALGYKNGPLLISKAKIYPDELADVSIAIPGKNTTANMLLSIACPEAKNKKEYLFSHIEEVVLSNECDAGLIIHENRFTYQDKGLRKIIDLGEFWEQKTQCPIPLGGIAISRDLDHRVQKDINKILQNSVAHAFANPTDSEGFVKQYAQEMELDVMYKHINLYVNHFSERIGEEGENAVNRLCDEAFAAGIVEEKPEDIFVADA